MESFASYLDGASEFLGFAGGAAIFLGLVALILIALREFFCWYWKVNQMVATLESIDQSLRHSMSRLKTIEKSIDTQIEPAEIEPEPVLWPPIPGPEHDKPEK